MPHYKEGKQVEQLQFSEIKELMKQRGNRLTLEQRAFFWLLYYGGMRKSELYERLISDLKIIGELHPHSLSLDIGQRKKGSAKTPPLVFPTWFPGMSDVCAWYEKAKKRKPSTKLLERWESQIRITKRVKAHWLFPGIHRSTSSKIVKEILGSQYYPHFLRLNRITELCTNPEANLTQIKSFTGIKSTRIIEENYMGISEREQKEAVNFIAKQIKREEG